MENKSFTDIVQKAYYNKADAPQDNQEIVAKPVFESILDRVGGDKGAAVRLMEKVFMPSLQAQLKDMGSTDIMPLRLVDVPGYVAQQANVQTLWLDWLLTKPVREVVDYQLRIIEEYQGTLYTDMINLEATDLPAAIQAAFGQRYNTVGCTGQTVTIGMMTQNINNMQGIGNVNVFENQVAFAAGRIKNTENKISLSNVEVVSELPGQVPQPGGFLTRSTNAPINAGGSNFTNTILQTAVNQLIASFGVNVPLALFVTSGQLAVIRDLMINRFPGENSATHLELMRNQYNAAGLGAKGLMTNVVYMPYPGVSIPVYWDRDMPANTAVLLKADEPSFARMPWFGQGNGPFVAMRPYAPMYDKALVFDIFSMNDPLLSSRVLIQNLAS